MVERPLSFQEVPGSIPSPLNSPYFTLLCLPIQLRFPIGGERVTCRGSKLTNSLDNNMNFQIARDQLVLLKTAENLLAIWRQANDFFTAFFF